MFVLSEGRADEVWKPQNWDSFFNPQHESLSLLSTLFFKYSLLLCVSITSLSVAISLVLSLLSAQQVNVKVCVLQSSLTPHKSFSYYVITCSRSASKPVNYYGGSDAYLSFLVAGLITVYRLKKPICGL